MKIYRVCRDCSDQWYQDFREYGFYFFKEKAIEGMILAIFKNEKIIVDILEIKDDEFETNRGLYYVEEINIR